MVTRHEQRLTARAARRLVVAERRLLARYDLETTARIVDVDGARVRLLEAGNGPTVLLLHGVGAGAAVWVPLLAELRDRRCIAVDLPGCGLSGPFDAAGIEPRAHARRLVAAVLDAVGAEDVTLVGNSLGGTLALYAAAGGERRTSRLVLLGATGVAVAGGRLPPPMALLSRPRVGSVAARLTPSMSPAMARRAYPLIVGRQAVRAVPDEMLDVVSALADRGGPTFRSWLPELFDRGSMRPELPLQPQELARVTVPTSLVWGSHDAFQDVDDGRALAAALPHGELVEVGGGHHPWWDDPRRCATLVREPAAGR